MSSIFETAAKKKCKQLVFEDTGIFLNTQLVVYRIRIIYDCTTIQKLLVLE